LDFKEYQEKAIKNKVYGYGAKIIYPALGLGNEAGEVQGKVKKVLRDYDGEFTPELCKGIAMEIGDTLWYCAALADDLGVSLQDIAEGNLKKLEDRRNRGVIQGSGDYR